MRTHDQCILFGIVACIFLVHPFLVVAGEREDDLRDQAYAKIMAEALAETIDSAWGQGGTSAVGKTYPYRKMKGRKALSACIDWSANSVERLAWYGFGMSVFERGGSSSEVTTQVPRS